jgi:cytochrome c peroxidase
LFQKVWGAQAFAVTWPNDVEQVCSRPGPPPASDSKPVHLNDLDRGRAAATFDQMAQSIASYEASAEVTPFTSKFGAVMAGKAQFTPDEHRLRAVSRQSRFISPTRRADHSSTAASAVSWSRVIR